MVFKLKNPDQTVKEFFMIITEISNIKNIFFSLTTYTILA